jgi:site-specific DNA recombinase
MIAIYARVSTEEQALKGYSIQNQIDEATKRAGTNDVLIYKDDGYSGEFLERPGLEKMRNDVREGLIKKIVCYDPDRLSRKLMNQLIVDEEFRRLGVDVLFVNGEYANTPEGQLFFSLRGAVAEFEKAKIRERTMSGRKSKAKQGKVVKNDHVYGYDYDKETGKMIIKEDEAEVVRMVFDFFTKPDSPFQGVNGIAIHLTEMGIPTKKGKSTWHRQVVRQLLMNETYTGKKAHNRWNTEGMLANKYKKDEKVRISERPKDEWIYVDCPAIISEVQFNQAQQLLEQSRRRFTKRSINQYLLSGLLRCGNCGNTMTGRKQKNWGKYVLTYSDVKNTAGAKNKGCGNHAKSELLDEIIWDQVVNLMNHPEQLQAYQPDQHDNSFEVKELERLEKEIERTKKGRKRLFTLITLSEEDMDLEEIKDQIRELQGKEKQLQEQYNELHEKIKGMSESSFNEELLKEGIQLFISMKEKEFSFEDKQKLIRMLIKEIRFYDMETIEMHLF